MLTQQFRLTRMKDFEILFKEGRFVGGNLVDLKVWKIDPTKYPKRKYSLNDLKIGFVVPIKISKKAVVRNRIKRQMREVVRLLLKDKCIKSGYFMLFLAKKVAIEAEYGIINQSVLDLLKKAGLYEKSN
jgi:ribonuclease P protein component